MYGNDVALLYGGISEKWDYHYVFGFVDAILHDGKLLFPRAV